MKVRAQLKNYRVSPQKVRSVAKTVRGLNVDEALVRLRSGVRKSNEALATLIASAVANAENNFKMDRNALFISEMIVDEGSILKRWMPRAHGRATKIMKRTSHVSIVLEAKKESPAVKKEEIEVKKEAVKKEKKVVKKVSEKKVLTKKKEESLTKDKKEVKKTSNVAK